MKYDLKGMIRKAGQYVAIGLAAATLGCSTRREALVSEAGETYFADRNVADHMRILALEETIAGLDSRGILIHEFSKDYDYDINDANLIEEISKRYGGREKIIAKCFAESSNSGAALFHLCRDADSDKDKIITFSEFKNLRKKVQDGSLQDTNLNYVFPGSKHCYLSDSKQIKIFANKYTCLGLREMAMKQKYGQEDYSNRTYTRELDRVVVDLGVKADTNNDWVVSREEFLRLRDSLKSKGK
jgi:hypothetical protein